MAFRFYEISEANFRKKFVGQARIRGNRLLLLLVEGCSNEYWESEQVLFYLVYDYLDKKFEICQPPKQ